MSDSTQHSRMASCIQDIVEKCKKNPSKIEIATANFQALLKAMKGYSKCRKLYSSLFENDAPNKAIQREAQIQRAERIERNKRNQPKVTPQAITELEAIYNRKLKHTELKELATKLNQVVGCYINRETKRSKTLLIEWFSINWETIRPLIYSSGLDKYDFDHGDNHHENN
ncbi:hypothetical protein TRFO_04875 [Tritrichomonas foetus]|uniref:Uncharacterized protein n=1 Tax=Tritrichomonas foetus TaxID=1144522 RepID=A0A1J4KBD0_9EUKA|nr:hypothetical protein TRFO_04875 [Tritrichomonas foetus]|eukprot:OHT08274.1 hypothetical protein TRFO_04875 [Tritrichomonas foetus]